jgi:hypothetical protein
MKADTNNLSEQQIFHFRFLSMEVGTNDAYIHSMWSTIQGWFICFALGGPFFPNKKVVYTVFLPL